MPDDDPDGSAETAADANTRRVAVEPPVFVETFASHHSLNWQAGDLSAFLDALVAHDDVPTDAVVVVDASNAAGRRRLPLSDVDATTGATTYVRAEPPVPWSVAWERRTTPVVSLTGSPTVATCRRFHLATTDCTRWRDHHRTALARALDAA